MVCDAEFKYEPPCFDKRNLSFKYCRHAFFAGQCDAPGRADTQTGWLLSGFQPFTAKIAFDRNFYFFFVLHRSEGAGINTFTATDAQVVVNKDDAIFISGNSVCRASVPAGRFGALVAVDRNEIRASFDHAYQPGADLQFVFLFAGHFAGMAPHAVIFFNNQRELSHTVPPIGRHNG
jgi:hypothetical protein